MFDPNQRSKAFNFALKTQDNFSLIIGAFIIWSFWAIFFSNLEYVFISKVLLTPLLLGFAIITPLIDFNESHATNPLWTGHARFHLVWQVLALTVTGIIIILLLWVFPSFSNLLISIALLYMWIICFLAAWAAIPLYDGKLNDINGVPPTHMKFFGKEYEVDRNVQGLVAAAIVTTYACGIIFLG